MNARIAVLFGALLFSHAAGAESFRCGQWIASPDMSVSELLDKCGVSTIETWTYDRGSQSFAMVVTIVDGRIKSMVRGE